MMVESRERKCSFLREVVRRLGLGSTTVEASRFEVLERSRSAQLVTIRAVKVDESTTEVLAGLLAPGGLLLAFGSLVNYDAFIQVDKAVLPDDSTVNLFRRR